jgi:hypothetical protein
MYLPLPNLGFDCKVQGLGWDIENLKSETCHLVYQRSENGKESRRKAGIWSVEKNSRALQAVTKMSYLGV